MQGLPQKVCVGQTGRVMKNKDKYGILRCTPVHKVIKITTYLETNNNITITK